MLLFNMIFIPMPKSELPVLHLVFPRTNWLGKGNFLKILLVIFKKNVFSLIECNIYVSLGIYTTNMWRPYLISDLTL